jgi:heat shock protein HtpX
MALVETLPRAPRRPRLGANYARTALLMGLLTALVVALADVLGGAGWAAAALVFMAVTNLASWYFSDRIVLAMHRATPLAPSEAPQVHAAVAELARRAGIPEPRVYYVPDPAPNAFATGRNPEHAAVAVTDGLLRILDGREIAAVIGHELSHVLNRDILIASVAATMAGAISLLARAAGWTLMLGRGSDAESRRNPLGALFLIIVAPLIALLLQLAVSRSREYGADATGARLSGDPEALASALAKLDAVAHEVPMRTADPATAHLYIVAPLQGAAGAIVELFSTHPRVEERIRRLREMRRGPV